MFINSPLVKPRPATAVSTGAQARAGALTEGSRAASGADSPRGYGDPAPEFSGQGSEGMHREPGGTRRSFSHASAHLLGFLWYLSLNGSFYVQGSQTSRHLLHGFRLPRFVWREFPLTPQRASVLSDTRADQRRQRFHGNQQHPASREKRLAKQVMPEMAEHGRPRAGGQRGQRGCGEGGDWRAGAGPG